MVDHRLCRCGHFVFDHWQGDSTCMVGRCRCETPELVGGGALTSAPHPTLDLDLEDGSA